MAQISHDLIHEAWVVSERIRHILQVSLGLVVATHADPEVSDQKVQLEDELKDLVHRDLKSIVSRPTQETLLQDSVQVAIV